MVNIRSHLRDPFFRSTYSLIAAQAVSATIGFFFWMAAARLMSAEDIGLGAGLLSAAMLVVSLASLGIDDVLYLLFPVERDRIGLLSGYFSLSIILAAVFTVGLQAYSRFSLPGGMSGIASLSAFAVFIVCVELIEIGQSQDIAFVAAQRPPLTLGKTLLASVAKLALLPPLALLHAWALVVVTAISTGIATCLFALDGFRWARSASGAFRLSFGVRFWRPLIASGLPLYVGNTLGGLPTTLMALLVLWQLGPRANGFFFVAFAFASTIGVVGSVLGVVVFSQSPWTADSRQIGLRRSTIVIAGLVVPTAITAAVFAPCVLLLYSHVFSTQASTIFRLVVLSAIPASFWGPLMGILKSQRRMGALVVFQTLFLVLHVTVTYALGRAMGLPGVGWGLILARTIAVAFVAAWTIRHLQGHDLTAPNQGCGVVKVANPAGSSR